MAIKKVMILVSEAMDRRLLGLDEARMTAAGLGEKKLSNLISKSDRAEIDGRLSSVGDWLSLRMGVGDGLELERDGAA